MTHTTNRRRLGASRAGVALLPVLLLLLLPFRSGGQVKMGQSGPPHSTSILELVSPAAPNAKGFLLPRMSTTARDAITNPATGLVIYNTTINCVEYWNSSTWISLCGCGNCPGTGTGALQATAGNGSACSSATVNGTYTAGTALAPGNNMVVSVNVTSVGNYNITTNTANGISFAANGTFTTTGVQNITLTGTGTPSAAGVNSYTVTFGTSSCTQSITTTAGGAAGTLVSTGGNGSACSSATVSGTYTAGTALAGGNTMDVRVNVTALGTFSISTDTVNGIFFSKSGTFSTLGTQTITLAGSGTPAAAGTNNLTVRYGSSTCTQAVTTAAGSNNYALAALTCDPGMWGNKYYAGTPVTSGNSLYLNVSVTTPGSYTVYSDTVNGVSFYGTGTFNNTGVRFITVPAAGTPVSAGVYKYTFHLGAGTCSQYMTVIPSGSTATGTLSYTNGTCAPASFAGSYTVGTPLNNSHTMTVQVDVTAPGTYAIYTDNIDGIMFAATGTFTTTGIQNVVLQGYGTPIYNGTYFMNPAATGIFGSCTYPLTVGGNNPSVSTGTLASTGGNGTACSSSNASGTYAAGIPVGSTEFISVSVNAATAGAYNIHTDTVNGVYFAKSGYLPFPGTQTVMIRAFGTPAAAGTFTYTFSYGTSTCTQAITVDSAAGMIQSTAGNGSPCTAATVNGTYAAGTPLTAANTIALSVSVGGPGYYTISTDTVNGISFRKTGLFTATGVQTVTLEGAGTPAAAGSNNYTVRWGNSTCTFSISPAGGNATGALASAAGNGSACSSATVNGTYTAGTALTAANTLSVNVNVATIGAYTIATNTANGISFSKTGVFTTTGAQTVLLAGSGTPAAAGASSYTITWGTSTCTQSITVTAAGGGGAATGTLASAGGNGTACSAATVNGGYLVNSPLNPSHQLLVSVNVATPGTYAISTNTVNGYSFSGSGTFTATGVQTVALSGTGTPAATGTNTFVITWGSSTCSQDVTVVQPATFTMDTTRNYYATGLNAVRCANANVYGTYTYGVPLDASNYATLSVNVTTPGYYSFAYSNQYGIGFTKSGTFTTTGPQTVTVPGYGTPNVGGNLDVYFYVATNNNGNAQGCAQIVYVDGAPVDGSDGALQSNGPQTPGSCSAAVVNGTYAAGQPVAAGNNMAVWLSVTRLGAYTIATDTVNGVYFRGTGNFTSLGLQYVVIPAYGTPTAAGVNNITVRYKNSLCTQAITTAAATGTSTGTLGGAGGSCTSAVLKYAGNNTSSLTTGTPMWVYNPSFVTPNSAYTLTVQVNVATPGAYNISTSTVNGYSFSGAGTFTTTGLQNVILYGSGTPLAAGVNTLTISYGASTCTTSITVGAGPTNNGVATMGGAGGSCTPATMAGTYTAGTALTAANTMTVQVNVTALGSYQITTPTLNGISFSKAGTFTALGVQNVILAGSGTPTSSGTYNYDVQAGTSVCSQPVTIGSGGTGTGTLQSTGGNGTACTAATVSGTYTEGTPLTTANKMTIQINVATPGTYSILTNTANGMYFTANGTFTATGLQNVTLNASGTPAAAGTNTYTVTFGGNTCTQQVTTGAASPSAGALQSAGGNGTSCTAATVNGSYQAGFVVAATSTMDVRVNVTTAGAYVITTDTVNGISFRKAGVFSSTGVKTVSLAATGTPVAAGTHSFTISYNGSTCTVPVTTTVAVASGTISSNAGACMGGSALGIFNPGVAVGTSNQIYINTNVTAPGNYTISTDTVNGISFRGNGVFVNTGFAGASLMASGTPLNTGTFTYTITWGGSTCTQSVTVVNPSAGNLSNTAGNGTACASATVNGQYGVTSPLGISNTMIVGVNVTSPGSYRISTDTVNGMWFSGTGLFNTTGVQAATIYGFGTPVNTGNTTFTLRYNSSTCAQQVTVGAAIGAANINCTSSVVNGAYYAGIPLGAGNTLTLSVDVTTPGAYSITTSPVNGMTFTGSGTYTTTGIQNITLSGSGTPVNASSSLIFVNYGNQPCYKNINVASTPASTGSLNNTSGNGTACSSATVNGTYQTNTALTAANTMTVSVNVVSPGTYSIATNNANGISFSKSGTFTTTGVQTVTLNGSGTPTSTGSTTYTITYGGSTCTQSVTVTTGPALGTLLCGSSTLGTYVAGAAMNSSNIFTLFANFTAAGAYTIKTDTVNGVSFTSTGNATTTGTQILTFVSSGTAVAAGTFTYTYTFGASTCTTNLTFVAPATATLGGAGGSCTAATVTGAYIAGTGVSSSQNTMNIQVNVSAIGGYSITTDTVNGIYFRGTGSFTGTGVQTAVLGAMGVPTTAGTNSYTVKYGTSTCTQSVTVQGPAATYSLYTGYSNYNNTGTQWISGNYTAGTVMSGSNTITLPIDVTDTGSYNISMSTVNGITFSGIGNFTTTGVKAVVLAAAGTATANGANTYTTGFPLSAYVPLTSGAAVISSVVVRNVTGAYVTGTATGAAHSLTVELTPSSAGWVTVTTNTVNGISFSGSMYVPNHKVYMRLQASGTPSTAVAANSVTVTANSVTGTGTFRTVAAANGTAAATVTCSSVMPNGELCTAMPVLGKSAILVPINVTTAGNYTLSATLDGVTYSAAGYLTTGTNQNIYLLPTTGVPAASGTYSPVITGTVGCASSGTNTITVK